MTVCSHCGTINQDNCKFCSECGAPLADGEFSAAAAVAAPEIPEIPDLPPEIPDLPPEAPAAAPEVPVSAPQSAAAPQTAAAAQTAGAVPVINVPPQSDIKPLSSFVPPKTAEPYRAGGLIAWSIITAVLFSKLCGFIGLSHAVRINKSYTAEEQEKQIRQTKIWCTIGTVIGFLAIVYVLSQ